MGPVFTLMFFLGFTPFSTAQTSNYNRLGEYSSYISDSCHYKNLSSLIKKPFSKTSDLAQQIQKWVDLCQPELSRFNSSAVSSLIHYATAKYPFEKNPHLQYVEFVTPEGYKARGILAIKDNKRRPFVVFRNGVTGDANESSVGTNFLSHVFDESPFHMLYLGNFTGADFVKENRVVALGGFDEGRHFHEIIKQLTANESSLRDLIQDVHVMSVSLGSHGALYSALYNSFRPDGLDKIKSVVALCPVVNLENSVNNLFTATAFGWAATVATSYYIGDLIPYAPVLNDYLKPGKLWKPKDISHAVTQSALRHYQEMTSHHPWNYPPFFGTKISDIHDFWNLNDFVQHAELNKTPTLLVHAEDDFVVRSQQNADLLFKKLQNNNADIGIVKLKKGSHCAFNSANGWPTLSSLLREFVLKHSSYKQKNEIVYSPLRYAKTPGNNSSRVLSKYTWQVNAGQTEAILKLIFFDKYKAKTENCRNQDYRFAPQSCYEHRVHKVPLAQFANLHVEMPKTDYEANRLSRWLNTHVTPVNSVGVVPYGTPQNPTHWLAIGE